MENRPGEEAQLSFPLPRSLDTKIHLRLSIKAKVILLYLTTVAAEDVGKPVPLGSFVYALPDRYNANQPLSTTIYHVEATLEFTTRLAKILVRKTGMPVYVANSISFVSTGLGGTVEEEMEAFKQVVTVVSQQLGKAGLTTQVNGVASS
ncbi:Proteasome assembly chaperone 4 [Microdochium nivale]|nr:Proteasome assembly chaperone 4 [Microdochium nivale]